MSLISPETTLEQKCLNPSTSEKTLFPFSTNIPTGSYVPQPNIHSVLQSSSYSRKRRWSVNHRSFENVKRKRSYSCVLKGENRIILPNKFLFGGTIDDPLNLRSLSSPEEKDPFKDLSSTGTSSSPTWSVSKYKDIEVTIPPNIKDPLNLNCSDSEMLNNKKRKRNRHKKKEDLSSSNGEQVPFDTPITIDVNCTPVTSVVMSDPLCSNATVMQSWKPRRKRRSTMSECAADLICVGDLQVKKTDNSVKEQKTNSTQQKDISFKKKSKKHVKSRFIHGNYNRYYGYRNSPDEKDPRLMCFNTEWFSSKDVLDIGCNVGNITIAVAKNFLPKKIVGLDIDCNLIHAARKNIRYYVDYKKKQSNPYPVSSNVVFGPLEAPSLGKDMTEIIFPENLSFKQGNYVLSNDNQLKLVKEEYDTILALSVTKWIHLNNGDDGIRMFFRRIYKHLRPGGILILEPQPWASYKKRKNLTPSIGYNFQNIKLKPEQFREFLLADVGFLKCEVMDAPNHKAKGFRRPIQVYTKSAICERLTKTTS